ncbi:MAG: flagellar biosynthesis regulator FlaF [Mangrovicoccus sp.]
MIVLETKVNAFSKARLAYSSASSTARAPKAQEYELFSDITRRLKKYSTCGGKTFVPFVQALHDNRKLWNALAIDVAGKENALPSELRAQIFYLAEFTNEHTSVVLQKKASPKVLIEINIAIMRGLLGGQKK